MPAINNSEDVLAFNYQIKDSVGSSNYNSTMISAGRIIVSTICSKPYQNISQIFLCEEE